MVKPDQIGWTAARRAKYSILIQAHTPWKTAGVKSLSGKNIVRWNNLRSGRQSAPILSMYRLLHETKRLINEVNKIIKIDS
jgi:hypothetical protein